MGKATKFTETKDAFEQRYAKGSGVTVEWLHKHGRYAAPCRDDCDAEDCTGWMMAREGMEAEMRGEFSDA